MGKAYLRRKCYPESPIRIRSLLSALLALAIVGACKNSTAPSESWYVPGKLILGALSSYQLVGNPGQEILDLPTVAVVSSSSGAPAAGVSVTFSLKSPDGRKSEYVTQTDGKGRAQLNAWRLGSAGGIYIATASADGTYGLDFRAFARGAVTARYDLELPAGSSAPSKSVVLYEDGSFYHVPFSALSGYPTGTYKWVTQSTVQFFLDPSNRYYHPAYAVYGDGVVNGDRLVLATGDVGDGSFIKETYIRR